MLMTNLLGAVGAVAVVVGLVLAGLVFWPAWLLLAGAAAVIAAARLQS